MSHLQVRNMHFAVILLILLTSINRIVMFPFSSHSPYYMNYMNIERPNMNMYNYNDSHFCGAVQTANSFKDEPVYQEQVLDARKGSSRLRVVKLVLINDHSMYKAFNGDRSSIRSFNRDLVSEMNNIYRKVGFRIKLEGNEIWSDGDKWGSPKDLMEALHRGHRYARDNYYYKYHYDSIQYLTMNKDFGRRQLGIAFLGNHCVIISSD